MSRTENPFVTERPVAGAELCGREPVLERLLRAPVPGPSVAVTGEPGSGFTSLARELARRCPEGMRPAIHVDASLAEGHAELAALIERGLDAVGRTGAANPGPGTLLVDGVGRVSEPPELTEALEAAPPDATIVLLGPGSQVAARSLEEADPEVVTLGRVPFEAWLPYALERFLHTDRWIGDEHVQACVDRTGGHARHTPALLAEVWRRTADGRVSAETVEHAWDGLLGRSGTRFLDLLAGLTANQRRVLRGLALEGAGDAPVRPYSSDFLARHGLSSPSSVQRSVDSLGARRLTTEDERGPRVRDPLLAAWLRRWPEHAVRVS